jgi:hypothetical protein
MADDTRMTTPTRIAWRWIAVSLIAIIAVATLTPSHSGVPQSGPWCFVCGEMGGLDVLLNLIMFLPLGAALALAGVRARTVVASCFLLSLTVESLQYFAIVGRDASIGDLVMNTLGGALGALIGPRWKLWLMPRERDAVIFQGVGAVVWLLALAGSGWLLQPSLPFVNLWGQLTPSYNEFETYDGHVLSLTVNGQPVGSEPLPKDLEFYRAFQLGEPRIEALVTIPGRASTRTAAIARIANPNTEALLLGQKFLDLVVRFRFRAADLRLRNPAIAVADAFPIPRGPARDTARIEAGMSNRMVHASLTGPFGRREWSVPLSVSLGWSFVLPFAPPIRATSMWLSFVWVAGLFFPLAYWTALAARSGGERRLYVLFAALTALVGLVAIPWSFGFQLPRWPEWCAVASSGVLAWIIAQRIDRMKLDAVLVSSGIRQG